MSTAATTLIDRIPSHATRPGGPELLVEECLNTLLQTTVRGEMDDWCVALEMLVTAAGPAPLYTHLYARADELADELARLGFDPTARALRTLVGPLGGAAHLNETVTSVLELLAQGSGPRALGDLHPTGTPLDGDQLTADACALSLIVVALLGALAAIKLGLVPGDARPPMLIAHDRPGVGDAWTQVQPQRINRSCLELIRRFWAHPQGLPALP